MVTLTDPLRYETAQDVNLRLHDSVVRYKGRPVYVQLSPENLHLHYSDLESRAEGTVHSSDVELDISSPPLGYGYSGNRHAYFLSRQPARRQKQGLCPSQCMVFDPFDGSTFQTDRRFHPLDHPAVARIILGDSKYNLEKAKKYSRDFNGIGGVVSRNLAVCMRKEHIYQVYYKTESVGFLVKDSFTPLKRFDDPCYIGILTREGLEAKNV